MTHLDDVSKLFEKYPELKDKHKSNSDLLHFLKVAMDKFYFNMQTKFNTHQVTSAVKSIAEVRTIYNARAIQDILSCRCSAFHCAINLAASS